MDGVLTLFVVGFVLRSLLFYAPGGPKEQIDNIRSTIDYSHPHAYLGLEFISFYEKLYDLEKPWPLDYLVSLFDPTDTTVRTVTDDPTVPGGLMTVTYTKGIDLFGIQGSGALTGDLGESMTFDRGRPVTEMFGKGLGEFMLLLLLSLPICVTALAVQRRKRPPIPGLPNYSQSRNLLHHYAHLMRLSGL